MTLIRLELCHKGMSTPYLLVYSPDTQHDSNSPMQITQCKLLSKTTSSAMTMIIMYASQLHSITVS